MIRRNPIRIIKAASPLVHEIAAIINQQPQGAATLSEKAGMNRNYIHYMARGGNVSIASMEALLDVLGYRLQITPKGESND